MRSHTVMPSPIGEITVVAEDGSLTGCYLEIHKRGPDDDSLGERDDVALGGSALGDAVRQLTEYFAGERTEFDLQLAPHGDEFQLRVWALLRTIPYGQTRSYGD